MIRFDPYRYDPESRILYRGDEEILLPPRVLAVLESLLKRPGKVVAKEDLLASAWDGTFVGEDSLTQAISQLRQALDDDPQRPTYIQTIPRRGYRFIAEVSEPLRTDAVVGEAPAAGPSTVEEPTAGFTPGERAVARTAEPKHAAAEPEPTPPLSAGTRLGRYELLSVIGAGAMGEVWRAKDPELDREVAIKLVPAELIGEKKAIDRFRREARMLAAVDHPNIATIHGVEEQDGVRFIVMELVGGRTLQDLLEEGALPVEEALGVALQVAEALEAAHERDIIHRDLKPANVVVAEEGRVKVLDFGLAKQLQPRLREATTESTSLTKSGVLLGTAPYMSPEQVRGRSVDKRTDIWAFGCLLYEMLTGSNVFRRQTVGETLAAILEHEPDWERLPADTPGTILRLLHRCLSKDPRNRLRDIGDARIVIEEVRGTERAGEARPAPGAAGAAEIATAAAGSSRVRGARASVTRGRILWGLAIVAALALGLVVGHELRPADEPRSFRFGIPLPPGSQLSRPNLAYSPLGTHVAYGVWEDPGPRLLYLRALEEDDQDARALTGTEGATWPVFSPDGESIAFLAQAALKKVSIRGGLPTTVCEVPGNVAGLDWGPDDILYYSSEGQGIMAVAASAGEPEVILAPDPERGELDLNYPEVLPGGDALLASVWEGIREDNSPIVVHDLRTGETVPVVDRGAYPRYVDGHVLFVRRSVLHAVPFDPGRLQVRGEPVPLRDPEGVLMSPSWGWAAFDLTPGGSLLYLPSELGANDRRLLSVDRAGNSEPITDDRRTFRTPRLSPDGRRLGVADEDGSIWIYHLEAGAARLLTSEGGNIYPVWTPDGEHIAFTSNRDGQWNLYWMLADGTGEPERLTTSDRPHYPLSWSPDGRVLAFEETRPGASYDIMLLRVGDEPSVEPHIATDTREMAPKISPDGRWLAYMAADTGRNEVYVEPFPERGERHPVSVAGGGDPIWSQDGTELFFHRADDYYVVEIEAEPDFRASAPRLMFRGSFDYTYSGNWDLSSDGRRFVFIEEPPTMADPRIELRIAIDWFENLKRRMPSID